MATATYPSSLEIVLDRATDQYARALALRRPNRLRWRGLEVSDEFQRYASRVARGEVLAPYRGPVLARACAEFPSVDVPESEAPAWTEPQRAPGAGRLWAGSLVLLLLALGSVIAAAPSAWSETAPAWLDTSGLAARVVPARQESAVPASSAARVVSAGPGSAVPASSPESDSLLSNATAATDRQAPPRPRAPRLTPPQVIPAVSKASATLGATPADHVPSSRQGISAQRESVSRGSAGPGGLDATVTSALLVESPTF